MVRFTIADALRIISYPKSAKKKSNHELKSPAKKPGLIML